MDKLEDFRSQCNVRRILAVTIGGLGDAILFSPVLKALRSSYPDAYVEMLLANHLAQAVYGNAGDVNNITVANLNHDFFLKNIAELICFSLRSRMKGGFDIGVFATGLNPRLSVFLKHAAGIRNIVSAFHPPRFATDLACNIALAQRFDERVTESETFFPLNSESRHEADQILKQHGLSWDSKNAIAICPSTHMWHRPRWGLTKLKRVIKLLRNNGFDGKILIIGSANEGQEWEHLLADGTGEINLAGQFSIMASASVISQCRLAICNDGGLMHVAGAVGCPLVTIMPNAPMTYKPPGEKTVMIQSNLPCSGCYPERPSVCNVADCTEDISVEKVFQACKILLSENG
jgi:heptosyltransferase-2